MSITVISEKRLTANRANAQKSTGPRTPQGKLHSSQNALRHAGYAQATLLPTDNQEEFAQFRTEWLQSLSPQTTPELYLTDRAVSLAWRLQRIVEADTTLHLSTPYRPSPAAALANATDNDPRNPFDQLNKSEDRVQSMLDRTLKQLRNLQTQRQKSPPPPCPFIEEENAQNEPTDNTARDSSHTENAQNEPTSDAPEVACVVASPPNEQFPQNEPTLDPHNGGNPSHSNQT